MSQFDIETKTINTLKGLIMDMVRNANSGHTGGAFSSLDFTYVLYNDFLKYNPDDPNWFNRDRFILSAGHESALLYSILTLIGWISIDDCKQFRQLGSKTPGHPEIGVTPGIEATSGPLGQGVGHAVGMAVAEAILAKQFGEDAVNHYTYVLHGDGDIQEPVAQGTIALAGHWKLGKLIAYYDANEKQISGHVNRSDSTDYAKMYASHGWHVLEVDGHNRDEIRSVIRQAQMEIEKPTVIIGHTIMAKGCANMEGDHNTHGAPLSPDEIAQTKTKLGLNPDDHFALSNDVVEHFQQSFKYAKQEASTWDSLIQQKCENIEFKSKWNNMLQGDFPEIEWPNYEPNQSIATRKVWGGVIEAIADKTEQLVGGSADLEPSNVTAGFAKMVSDFNSENHVGRNFAYGVREFPMGAINNGIGLHGGLKVFGATFFVFSDYERPALRMRALQNLPVISEYTHDSFYVGEDGPTHQPIEHIMACRAIPNLLVLRPGDANEAVVASQIAFEQKNRPSVILLTRQGLPVLDRNVYPSADEFRKGGYIVSDCEGDPDITIITTGSEVWVALEAKNLIYDKNIRVVNLGCWKLFEEQSAEYKESVLGRKSGFRVSIEAGITMGWERYTGINGLNIGIDTFAESAPGNVLADHFGLTPEKVAQKISSVF